MWRIISSPTDDHTTVVDESHAWRSGDDTAVFRGPHHRAEAVGFAVWRNTATTTGIPVPRYRVGDSVCITRLAGAPQHKITAFQVVPAYCYHYHLEGLANPFEESEVFPVEPRWEVRQAYPGGNYELWCGTDYVGTVQAHDVAQRIVALFNGDQ